MAAINHQVLSWARETAGLSVADAAQKLGFKDTSTASAVEKLTNLENGDVQPTRAVLAKMATHYRRPLLTFYLPHPPAIADRGSDFRTLSEPPPDAEVAQVDALVRSVKVKQELIKAALIDEDEAEILPFIGSVSIASGVAVVAAKIISELGIQLNVYRRFNNQGDAFEYLRAKIESNRIFVILKGNLGSHHTDIDVKAFRGFALADSIAPFVVINDHDSKAAWSFTLLHEVVHLFLGQSGISGAIGEQAIEKFCNDVASEILLPNAELNGGVEFSGLSAEELKGRICQLAIDINVSRTLIAYRLHRVGLYNFDFYESLLVEFRQEWIAARDKKRRKNKEQDGGPHPYVVGKHKLGNLLVGMVQRFNESGSLPATKAAIVLGIKPIKLYSFLSAGRAA